MSPSSLPPGTSASGPKVQYTSPDGWIDEGPKGMRLASFKIEDGEEKGEVTVMFLGGDVPSNVKRWQGQVSPTAAPEELDQATEKAIADAKS